MSVSNEHFLFWYYDKTKCNITNQSPKFSISKNIAKVIKSFTYPYCLLPEIIIKIHDFLAKLIFMICDISVIFILTFYLTIYNS